MYDQDLLCTHFCPYLNFSISFHTFQTPHSCLAPSTKQLLVKQPLNRPSTQAKVKLQRFQVSSMLSQNARWSAMIEILRWKTENWDCFLWIFIHILYPFSIFIPAKLVSRIAVCLTFLARRFSASQCKLLGWIIDLMLCDVSSLLSDSFCNSFWIPTGEKNGNVDLTGMNA